MKTLKMLGAALAAVTMTFTAQAANGGTGTMADQICVKGKVYNLTKCAFTAPTGKAFAGWACKETGKRYDDSILIFNAAAEGKVLTLTAIWE